MVEARLRGSPLLAVVDRIESGGLALNIGGRGSTWTPWPLFGLAEAPVVGGDHAALRWRVHCVNPDSRLQTFHSGAANRLRLNAQRGQGVPQYAHELRTGILEVELKIERGAQLQITVAQGRPVHLHLGQSFNRCLEHHQSWDKGAVCLCGCSVHSNVRSLAANRGQWLQQSVSANAYALKWGAMVELEAAASAAESNDSRLLFDVNVVWKQVSTDDGVERQGHFHVPVSLARAHRLKFRGLVPGGGEHGSSWLCMCELAENGTREPGRSWKGHAKIVKATIVEEGAPLFGADFEEQAGDELLVDDEEIAVNVSGRRCIHVVCQVLNESSDFGMPSSAWMILEYVPKALSYSMMHLALGEVNPREAADGSSPAPLLARDVVLGRPPSSTELENANLTKWSLNPSQEQSIQKALARSLMLIHGPPGTGKTRTAAVLMTELAQRNLGSRCATLFSATTNRAVDCALFYTNQLCETHFAERLRARVEDDGEGDCAICLEERPDIVTACGHVFHRDCVAQSLQQSGICPICRQILKQPGGGLRMLRVYGADAERQDFPVPRRVEHQGIQSFKVQEVPEAMRRFTLHWRCHAAVEGEAPTMEAVRARQAYEKLRSTSTASPDFDECRALYQAALSRARAAEVRQADIIFATCVSARRTALLAALKEKDAPKILQVVLDEAGQAPEPEALCPLALAHEAKRIVLFGDHKQLRPILKSKAAEDAGMGISLFERLVVQDESSNMKEANVQLLAEQYRMHPSISHFPRTHFYAGRVSDHPTVLERKPGILGFQHQGKDGPVFHQSPLILWDGGDKEVQEEQQRVRTVGAGGVGSRANLPEARRAAALAVAIADVIGDAGVAVLSWYNNQVARVKELLQDGGRKGIHVGSIATAQGSEWEYVILSAVRSDTTSNLGLLTDPHTFNVALTRAQQGLVVLCNVRTMQRDRHWAALVGHCTSKGLVTKSQPAVRQRKDVLGIGTMAAQTAQTLHLRAQSLFEASGSNEGSPCNQTRIRSVQLAEIPMEAKLQASAGNWLQELQAGLDRCQCGNFANPKLRGRCNACHAVSKRSFCVCGVIIDASLREKCDSCCMPRPTSNRRRHPAASSSSRSLSRVSGVRRPRSWSTLTSRSSMSSLRQRCHRKRRRRRQSSSASRRERSFSRDRSSSSSSSSYTLRSRQHQRLRSRSGRRRARSSSSGFTPSEGEVHEGVMCNGCGMSPVKGPRLSCMTCENVNFCEQCYSKRSRFHPLPHKFYVLKAVRQKHSRRMRHQNPKDSKNLKHGDRRIRSASAKAAELKKLVPNKVVASQALPHAALVRQDAQKSSEHLTGREDSSRSKEKSLVTSQPHDSTQAVSPQQTAATVQHTAEDGRRRKPKEARRQLPRKAKCAYCKKRLRGKAHGLACGRYCEDGSLSGCGGCCCWDCMKATPESILGRIRAERKEFEALGSAGWWMHEKCMNANDVMDYSVLMMPVPMCDDAGNMDKSENLANHGKPRQMKTQVDQSVSGHLIKGQCSEALHALPDGWDVRTSRSMGQVYYVDMRTLKTQWFAPPCKCKAMLAQERCRRSEAQAVEASGQSQSSAAPASAGSRGSPEALAMLATVQTQSSHSPVVEGECQRSEVPPMQDTVQPESSQHACRVEAPQDLLDREMQRVQAELDQEMQRIQTEALASPGGLLVLS